MPFKAPISYHFLESVDSTNTWVKLNHAQFNLNSLHVLRASEQTQGRGTQGKSWVSPKRLNVYASLFFALPERRLYSTLAQMLSVTIADVLQMMGFDARIKWPNDLLVNDRKICGILCEIIPIANLFLVILGVGINVNMPQSLCATISQPVASLYALSQELYSPEDLLTSIAEKFQKELPIYLQQGFQPFLERYQHYMTYIGYPVMFDQKLVGTSHAVNVQGELEVLTEEGKILSVTYGSIKI
jgi:BirA family transcriptional regulator, biotin operon repressor / biotin---[acetyl-CoA-carboxylase] ligase